VFRRLARDEGRRIVWLLLVRHAAQRPNLANTMRWGVVVRLAGRRVEMREARLRGQGRGRCRRNWEGEEGLSHESVRLEVWVARVGLRVKCGFWLTHLLTR